MCPSFSSTPSPRNWIRTNPIGPGHPDYTEDPTSLHRNNEVSPDDALEPNTLQLSTMFSTRDRDFHSMNRYGNKDATRRRKNSYKRQKSTTKDLNSGNNNQNQRHYSTTNNNQIYFNNTTRITDLEPAREPIIQLGHLNVNPKDSERSSNDYGDISTLNQKDRHKRSPISHTNLQPGDTLSALEPINMNLINPNLGPDVQRQNTRDHHLIHGQGNSKSISEISALS